MTAARVRIAVAVALLGSAGCNSDLETGYQPRPLSASEADRKSYYAPAYSPAAQPDKAGTGFSFQR